MKRNYRYILIALTLAIGFYGFKKYKRAKDRETSIMQGVQRILDYAHYQPIDIQDKTSEKIFDDFFKKLDPSKRYFIQNDYEYLTKYKYQIDDEIKDLDLSFYLDAFQIIKERQDEVLTYVDEILSVPFDFSKNEILNTNYDSIPYAKSKKDIKERWRKYLKLNVLSRIHEKVKEEEEKEKKDKSYKKKTKVEIQKEALEATKKSMKRLKEIFEELEENEYFSMFMNSITNQYDPHTTYFSPQTKERFDTSMSGFFYGIGARLQKEGEYIKIVEIIPGGPAWKADVLKVGDVIKKVAQGDEEPVDIMGMRMSKAIKMIKGPKGTVVKLTLKRAGSTKVVSITRDRVEIEETFAKSLIINNNYNKYGYIYLPGFYINFKERNERNAASDIKIELEKLKKENVKGIILDLRNNGGGSLSTVIEMGGFFIDKGPIVQVKDKKGEIEVLKDKKEGIIYNGNLVILINELSASASEILAAAMQDYKRAIIIGSNSYGKGTVQNVISINQIQGKKFGDLGAIKWTTKKFYRINGGSTQIKGVTPDIIVPDTYSYLEVREENEPTALKWDKINKAKYKMFYSPKFDKVIKERKEKIKHSIIFNNIDKKAKWIAKSQKDYTIYLKYEAYKKDIEKNEKESKMLDSLTKFNAKYEVNTLKKDLIGKENDSIFTQKRNRWIKAVKKDVYINEAVKVLEKLNK